MGDLLKSFPGRTRVKPKSTGKTCVSLWGQFIVFMSSHRWSVGPGCYIIIFYLLSFYLYHNYFNNFICTPISQLCYISLTSFIPLNIHSQSKRPLNGEIKILSPLLLLLSLLMVKADSLPIVVVIIVISVLLYKTNLQNDVGRKPNNKLITHLL